MKEELLIGKGILWVLLWFGFMLLYTALDVGVWRKIAPLYAKYLNLVSIILCMVVFLVLLTKKIISTLASEESYQQTIESLGSSPVIGLIRVCVLAPVIEEILMIGFLLEGLAGNYGKVIALPAYRFPVLLYISPNGIQLNILCGNDFTDVQ